jgi:hypothetical protein
MPRGSDIEMAEAASLSNLHEANRHIHTPFSEDASDMSRVEALEESPNPQASVGLRERSTWISTPELRPEPYTVKPAKPQPVVYHPYSIHVFALLMSFSVFGTLARLGIHALATYNGQSIFPLAWVQAVGCGIMGFAVGLRDPITRLYVKKKTLFAHFSN